MLLRALSISIGEKYCCSQCSGLAQDNATFFFKIMKAMSDLEIFQKKVNIFQNLQWHFTRIFTDKIKKVVSLEGGEVW